MTSRYDERPRVLDRLALACGAGWVVAALVGNSLTEEGAPAEETPAAAQAYFALLRSGSHRVGLGVELLGLCLLVVFLAKAFQVLRDAEGPAGWLAGLGLAGGLVTVAVKLGSGTAYLVGIGVEELPAEQALLLQHLNGAGFVLTAMTSGLLVLGLAGSALVSGALPRWLAGIGLAVGAVAVLGSLGADLDGGPGVLGFLLGLLWVLASSLMLAVRGGTGAGRAGHEAVLAPA